MDLKYRALNPRNDEDITKYIELVKALGLYCNDCNDYIDDEFIKWASFHMGAVEVVDTQYQGKLLPDLEDNADDFVFVCEDGDKFIGYVEVCSYHIENGDRPDDDIGILHEIFVLDEYRNGFIAYTLLQLAVSKLQNKGKRKAICNVQEDNPNRFLHFAMADNNVIKSEACQRADGSVTTDYTLLVDLGKLKNTSFKQLAMKTVQLQKNNKHLITDNYCE